MNVRMNSRPGGSLQRWIVAIALASTAAWGGAAIAQPFGPGAGAMGGPGMHQGRLDRRLDTAGATTEQKAQIHAILKQAFQDLADVRAQRRANRQQMRTALAQPSIDANAIEALRQQQIALADASSKRWTQAIIAAANVLTPEQRSAMAQTRLGMFGGR